MSGTANVLLRTTVVSCVAMAAGPVGTAIAAPNVTITSPLNGSVSNNPTPSFKGRVQEAGGAVTLRIYKGPTAEGIVIQKMSTALLSSGGMWSVGPAKLLTDGTYTAQATQTGLTSEIPPSSPVTFTVDTAAPRVTLNLPQSPSSNTTPSFTGTASDTSPVTVQIQAAEGTVVSTATATGTGGAWTSGNASPPLSSGQYTAIATQESSLGNPAGESGQVTFTVTPPPVAAAAAVPPPVPPLASFTRFPSGRETGEPVLMQPFPVVRIAGTGTALGVVLSLLKVQQLPAGARITVRCRGPGCPIKSVRRVATPNKRGVAPIEFRRLEHTLRFGVTVEILISKPGEIGKYTRFTVRRGRLPERVDMCLDPARPRPLVCPSS